MSYLHRSGANTRRAVNTAVCAEPVVVAVSNNDRIMYSNKLDAAV